MYIQFIDFIQMPLKVWVEILKWNKKKRGFSGVSKMICLDYKMGISRLGRDENIFEQSLQSLGFK